MLNTENKFCEWQLLGSICTTTKLDWPSLQSRHRCTTLQLRSSTTYWSPSTASIHLPSKPISEDPTGLIHSSILYCTAKHTTGSTCIFWTPKSFGTACLRMWPQPPPLNPSSLDYPIFDTRPPLTKVGWITRWRLELCRSQFCPGTAAVARLVMSDTGILVNVSLFSFLFFLFFFVNPFIMHTPTVT